MNRQQDDDLDGITGAALEKRILEMAASDIAIAFDAEVRRKLAAGWTLRELFGDEEEH